MSKPVKFLHFDDYSAMEADVNLTAHIYTRTNASSSKWGVLEAKIEMLKRKILKK